MSVGRDTNDLKVIPLVATPTLSIRDIRCNGACRHRSPSECASSVHFVFPYRGLFMRHVGARETVAETNQLVFFNEGEDYAISHPVGGGDACLSIELDPAALRELAPAEQLQCGPAARFAHPRRRVDPRAQALVARLRHGLSQGVVDQLEAETLALALIRRSLGERTSHARATTYGREKLVSRTKLLLAADPGRRWTSAEIGKEIGVSPVYLTQIFSQAEGIPLYRYQTRLRLASALDRLPGCRDLTMLGLDLGFSSHSHFTAAFSQHFGQSPAAFQRASGLR